MAIKKIAAKEARGLKGKTNWEEVAGITDEEIEKAVNSDLDSSLPTKTELEQFSKDTQVRKAI